MRTLDLQLRPLPASGAGTTTAAVADAALEEAVRQALAQHSEAQQVRGTYVLIARRLKGERAGFDQQLAALEHTLALKRHDLAEVSLLSQDAIRARDHALQELSKRKATWVEEQTQRQRTLLEKQQLIQERLRKRKDARRAAANAGASLRHEAAEEGGDGAGKGSDMGADETGEDQKGQEEAAEADEDAHHVAARKLRLEGLQRELRRIKDVVGESTVEGVRDKVASQAAALDSLSNASHENQTRLERLQEERAELTSSLARLRFAPRPARSIENDDDDDVAGELVQERERVLGQLQHKHRQLLKLFKGTKCCAEHLAYRLRRVRPVHDTSSTAPEGELEQQAIVAILQGIEQWAQQLQQ